MASRRLEQRRRKATDSVSSTTEVARRLHVTRQAVDKAVREGRIAGFQDPTTRRIWVWTSGIDDRADDVQTRLAALEGRLAEMNSAHQTATRLVPLNESTVGRLRAELVTVRAVNLELLAAASDQEEADQRLQDALSQLSKALESQQEAYRLMARAAHRYRDAVSQTQLPPTAPDDGT